MKRGFTLLELIIVIIIIGVLATLGFTQYAKIIEKGRKAEAMDILGSLRQLQGVYFLERGEYTATFANLALEAGLEEGAYSANRYFAYTCADTGTCTATRCLATDTACKSPGLSAYTITMAIDGTVNDNDPND